MSDAPVLGLCMIVKNEAHVIERALDSAKGLIDYVLIEDTGSEDGTQDVIRQWLDRNNLPGQVIDEPWQSFAYNRTHALEAMRRVKHVDYVLVFDADDTIRWDGKAEAVKRRLLTADSFTIDIHQNDLLYRRYQICSNRKAFIFRGVVHEFMHTFEKATNEHFEGIQIWMIGGGARFRDPDTYRHDAEKFEEALRNLDPREEELRPRYLFYLAQSYRASGQKEKALETYGRRVKLGGWIEETFIAQLAIGRLKEELQHPFPEIMAAYQQCFMTLPHRQEPLYYATKFCRAHGFFAEGYSIAKRGIGLPIPKGQLLYVELPICEWGLMDEFSVCANFTGHYVEAFLAAEYILRVAGDSLGKEDRERVEKNVLAARQDSVTKGG